MNRISQDLLVFVGNEYRPLPKNNILVLDNIKLRKGLFFFVRVDAAASVSVYGSFRPSFAEREGFPNESLMIEFKQTFDEEVLPENYAISARSLSRTSVSSREVGYWIAVSNMLTEKGILSLQRSTDMPEGLSVLFELAVGKHILNGSVLASDLLGFMEVRKETSREYMDVQ